MTKKQSEIRRNLINFIQENTTMLCINNLDEFLKFRDIDGNKIDVYVHENNKIQISTQKEYLNESMLTQNFTSIRAAKSYIRENFKEFKKSAVIYGNVK